MLSSKLSKRGASFDENLRGYGYLSSMHWIPRIFDRWGNLRDLPTKALEMVNCHGDFLMGLRFGNSSH